MVPRNAQVEASLPGRDSAAEDDDGVRVLVVTERGELDAVDACLVQRGQLVVNERRRLLLLAKAAFESDEVHVPVHGGGRRVLRLTGGSRAGREQHASDGESTHEGMADRHSRSFPRSAATKKGL